MDLRGLATLGKVAGIGGVAIGGAVLILNSLIQGPIPGLPDESRGEVVRLAVIGAFGLAALGLLAWALVAKAGGNNITATGRRDAAAGGRDSFVNSRITNRSQSETSEKEAATTIRAKGKRDAAAGGRDAGVKVVEAESGGSEIAKRTEAGRGKPAPKPPKGA